MDNNLIDSYTSTWKQQNKYSNPDINDKINTIQNNCFRNNYTHETLFESFPINTRITSRDNNDKSRLLSGKSVIIGGSLDSAEFIHNQYKNTHKLEDFKKNNSIDSNSFIMNQFQTINNGIEQNYNTLIDKQYSNPEETKYDKKNLNNNRLDNLGLIPTNKGLPINNKIMDNKHSYPCNTR